MKKYLYAVYVMLVVIGVKILLNNSLGVGLPFFLMSFASVFITFRWGLGPSLLGVSLAAFSGKVVFSGSSLESLLSFLVLAGSNYFLIRVFERKKDEDCDSYLEEAVQERTRELNLTKEQLELVMKSAQIGVFDRDIKTNKLSVNDEFKVMHGFPVEVNPTFEDVLSLIHPDDLSMIKERLKIADEEGRSYGIESRVVLKNGEVHWHYGKGHIYKDKKGRPTRMIGAVANIDERKKFQVRLEQEVLERTMELKIAQMFIIQSAKMTALGEMANGVAHELNSPLSAIRLKSELIQRKFTACGTNHELADFLKKELTEIISIVGRVSDIIKGLQTFSKGGENELPKPLNLRSVIEKVLLLTKTKMTCDGIDVRFSSHEEDLSVFGVEGKIEQVLMNLLSNSCDALKAREHKWVSIEIVEAETNLQIMVTDSGPGVPVDIRDKIMQPFFTTKEVGSGTGLGLSVAKGLVESMQGTLELDQSCASTRFIVSLPKAV